MDMATLLEESFHYQAPERGEIIEGTVLAWDNEGAIVDIGSKSEGVIPRHEMQSLGADPQSKLPAGEKVLVSVVQQETSEGQVLLSIDRARGEQGWRTLQDWFEAGQSFEGEVTGHNRGGLLVNVEGVNAFVPLSQVVGVRPDHGQDEGAGTLASQVGRSLRLKVIEINRRRNRVILSERAALQEWRMQQKERLIQELHEGDIRRGRISSVRSFGVFVDLGGADGLAHLSELSWERDKTPAELFKVGDEVDAYVTKIDHENKKIALSLRRANPEPWNAIVDNYAEGRVITGLVTKLVPFGAFARIEGPVEGLIHVSELVDRRIEHPKEVVREGDLLPLKIVRIERDRHRLGLSLRRARDEGQVMGYVFSDGGEVLSVPDDVRADFEAREGPIPPPPPPLAEEAPVSTTASAPQAEVTEAPAGAVPDAQTAPASDPVASVDAAPAEAPVAETTAVVDAPAEASSEETTVAVKTTEDATAEETTAAVETTEDATADIAPEAEPSAEATVLKAPEASEEPSEETPAATADTQEESPAEDQATEPAPAAEAPEPEEDTSADEADVEETPPAVADAEPQPEADEAGAAEEPQEATTGEEKE